MELTKIIKQASIDLNTSCQLRCVSCSTSKGLIRNGYIKEGSLKFKQFKKILDQNEELTRFELSNWGEIFLNK